MKNEGQWDEDLHQMSAIWITAGNTWRRVKLLHDQSLLMYMVPQAIHATTRQVNKGFESPESSQHTQSAQVP
jgi:hypothetical protein